MDSTFSSEHHNTGKIIVICFVASLAGLLFGMDTGIISGALPFLGKQFHLSTFTQECIVSAVLLGAFIGTVGSGFVSKRLGRKNILLLSACIFIVASGCCALANSADQLIIFRLFLGMAVGMAAFNAPLYLAEMAPKKIRGTLISFYQTMVNIGILTALGVDTYFTYTEDWRSMLAMLGVPAVFMLIGIIFLPKSPRWLILKNRRKEAHKVLKKIRNCSDEQISMELSEIENVVKDEKNGFTLFKQNKNFRKVIYLGIAIQAAQQLTGINVMFYYAPTVFHTIGFETSVAGMWGGVILGVVFVISGFTSLFLVDRYGRRPLLHIGAVFMGIAFVLLSILIHFGIASTFQQVLAVASLVLFMFAFGISSAPIAWIIVSEICPLQGRSFGMAISTSTNWIANFFIGMTFLSILNRFGSQFTFALLGVINFALIIIYFYFTPETKDVSLEDLEKNLMNGIKLRNIGR
jgi:MFS transporter, SP family, galactose:H+ symporter